jgi:hypothetical protein
MARHKDVEWNLTKEDLPGNRFRTTNPEDRVVAVLMDIRDEMKELNALLHCHNFTGIPATLRSIRRKLPTAKKGA